MNPNPSKLTKKSDSTGLQCVYSNVDQLLNKMEDLKSLISSNEPDIILLTEIIPKAHKNPIYQAQINIHGYEKFTNFDLSDYDLGSSGKRGVAIYVKEGLETEEVKLETEYEDHLWLEVKLRNRDHLLCGCIYRSPTKDKLTTKETTEKVCNVISEALQRNNTQILICGDFNYPEIDWDCDYVNNESVKPFIVALQEHHLHQHVCNPTRYREGQEPSLLDLILTTEEGMIQSLEHNPGLGESDHECLNFTLNCYMDTPVKKPAPNYYKADYVTIRNRLEAIEWIPKLRGGFLEAYPIFVEELERAMEGCIPKNINRRKKKSIYMTRDSIKLKDLKAKLWKRYKKSKTHYDRERYQRVKNELRSKTRRLRIDFENDIAQNIKTHPKRFWNYVKSRTKSRSKIPPLMTKEGTKASTASEKAEALNNYFSSTFTEEMLDNIPDGTQEFLGESLDKFDIPPESVLKKLLELNPNKSPGPDGWHPVLLKSIADLIALPLSIIFQKSLNEGILPSQWLKACITAIHKKGEKGLIVNYHPISITSIICKIMESLVRDRLVDHMLQNNLFSEYQHGFVPRGNCMTNLLACLEKWTYILESNDSVDVIYTDFAKAFDSVPHQRLIRKLKGMEIVGETLTWIESFLSNRFQRVRVEDEYSTWKRVKSGIPQGSVLGPILFVVFINDMPEEVKSMCQLFADDAKILASVNVRDENAGVQLQQDLNSLSNWSEKWQLPFNVLKCKVLHIGKNNPCRRYKMMGKQLEDVAEEKDLAVLVDNGLKFQTAAAVKKANCSLGLIKKSFALLDNKTLPLLYKSLVRPHLEYGNVVWGPFYKEDEKLVEKVQKRATKVIPQLKGMQYDERLRSLNLPSLQYRRRRGDMIFAYKVMTDKVKLDSRKLFKSSDRTMRGHQYKIQKKQTKKLTTINACSNRIVNDWNILPSEVVSATSTNAFKNKLDDHWKDEMFQTPF